MKSSKQVERGRGKNKRRWSHHEDVKLIDALLELVNEGVYKAENGFKPGYCTVLEDKLNVMLPNSGLKAKPHIESRMKTLKKEFGIMQDMLNGNTSGFGWDNEKKCITAEKSVWDAYLQSHSEAANFMNRPIPFYEDLSIIFGKDRATGKDSEAPADVVEEMDREEKNNENDVAMGDDLDDMNASMSYMQSHTSEECSSRRGKKRNKISDNLAEGIMNAAMTISKEIREATMQLTRAIGVDIATADKRGRINVELRKLHGLSMMERHKATALIGRDHEMTDIFFTIDDEEKEEWVRGFLRGEF